MIPIYNLFEIKDYTSIHGHEKISYPNPEAYFHNYATHNIKGSPNQTPGYQHCVGKSNTKEKYFIIHIGNKHGINTEYALGHDKNRKATWFKFTKKLNDKFYDLSSGVVIDKDSIP